MTLAICTACGSKKFGALVPCPVCGKEPPNAWEKAQSILLTDHYFPASQLWQISREVRTHGSIPYDNAKVMDLAFQMLEYEHFEKHWDHQRNQLPCSRCSQGFTPEAEEGLCPGCASVVLQALASCPRCTAVFDDSATFCQICGDQLQPSGLSPQVLGRSTVCMVQLAERRLTSPEQWDKSTYLPQMVATFDQARRDTFFLEMRHLAMCCALMAVFSLSPERNVASLLVDETLRAFFTLPMLHGAPRSIASAITNLFLDRRSSYEAAMAARPDEPVLAMALEAAAYLNLRHAGAVTELGVFVGYFGKVFHEGYVNLLRR